MFSWEPKRLATGEFQILFFLKFYSIHFTIISCRVVAISSNDTNLYLKKVQTNPFFKGAYGYWLPTVLHLNQINPIELRYEICKEPLMMIPLVIYTRKNFYLLEELNEKIEYFKAAGLIELWQFQDIDFKLLNYKSPNYPKVLSLHQLSGSFQILLWGLFVSCLVFLAEKVVFNLCQKLQSSVSRYILTY